MPTHQQFLAAILAAPDALAPRLIYADWLEEQGSLLCHVWRKQTARTLVLPEACRSIDRVGFGAGESGGFGAGYGDGYGDGFGYGYGGFGGYSDGYGGGADGYGDGGDGGRFLS